MDLPAALEKFGVKYEPQPAPLESPERSKTPHGVRRSTLALPASEIAPDEPENVVDSRSRTATASLSSSSSSASQPSAAASPPPPAEDGGAANGDGAVTAAAATPTTNAEGAFFGGNDMRGLHPRSLATARVTLRRRPSRPITAGTNLLVGPTDSELAPLIALYYDHGGDMAGIFKELGESPRKALKHPPVDAMDFATKFIAGKLTDYAAPKVTPPQQLAAPHRLADTPPRTSLIRHLSLPPLRGISPFYPSLGLAAQPAPGLEERLESQDHAMTPVQALASIFPALPHEVLFAVLEATNGNLDNAVHLLLESGANLQEDNPGTGPKAKPPKRGEAPREAGLSAMQRQAPPPEENEDFVLAITVPQGSRPNALLKITTTIGTVHARVPPGVMPGQSFFIRMRRGSPYASTS